MPHVPLIDDPVNLIHLRSDEVETVAIFAQARNWQKHHELENEDH